MYAYVSFWYFIFIADHKAQPYLLPNIIAGATFVLLVFAGTLALTFADVIFWEGNIYHKPGLKWSSAMCTLVAHAGVLDEGRGGEEGGREGGSDRRMEGQRDGEGESPEH